MAKKEENKKPGRPRKKVRKVKTQAYHDKLSAAVNRCFSTEDGKQVLLYLKNQCGFDKSSIVGNPQTGDVMDRGTLYNEARRGVYLELRGLIKPDILRDIEYSTIGE